MPCYRLDALSITQGNPVSAFSYDEAQQKRILQVDRLSLLATTGSGVVYIADSAPVDRSGLSNVMWILYPGTSVVLRDVDPDTIWLDADGTGIVLRVAYVP